MVDRLDPSVADFLQVVLRALEGVPPAEPTMGADERPGDLAQSYRTLCERVAVVRSALANVVLAGEPAPEATRHLQAVLPTVDAPRDPVVRAAQHWSRQQRYAGFLPEPPDLRRSDVQRVGASTYVNLKTADGELLAVYRLRSGELKRLPGPAAN
jgi:hypothetical protein